MDLLISWSMQPTQAFTQWPPLSTRVIWLAVLQVPSVTIATGKQSSLSVKKLCNSSHIVCFTQTDGSWTLGRCKCLPLFDAILSHQRWSDGHWSARPKWMMKARQTVRLHKSAGRCLTGNVSCHRPSQHADTETHKSCVILLSFMYSRQKDFCPSFPGHERAKGAISHQTQLLFFLFFNLCKLKYIYIYIKKNSLLWYSGHSYQISCLVANRSNRSNYLIINIIYFYYWYYFIITIFIIDVAYWLFINVRYIHIVDS